MTEKPSSIALNDIRPDGRLRQAYWDAFNRVMESGVYILGPEVKAFERELADEVGAQHAVGVASGTDALELALRVLDAPPGSHVMTVANSAPATAIAIVRAGLYPIYVDVNHHGLMSPTALGEALAVEKRLGAKVAAIVPVDLYGQPSISMDIISIAAHHGVPIIQDAAQSIGSGLAKGSARTLMAAVSFYPTKALGGMGDGGAIVTNDKFVADALRLMRFYGIDRQNGNLVRSYGINSRLDELQAALLRARLQTYKDEIRERTFLASYYRTLLSPSLIRRSAVAQNWHLFTIHCKNRCEVQAYLDKAEIASAVHYQYPAWKHPMTQGTAATCDLPKTREFMDTTLTLPLHSGMSLRDIARVADVINRSAKP